MGVYSLNGVKNIILSARDILIEAVRRRVRQTARAETTLRDLQLVIFSGGRKFTRDEMNER